MNDLAEKLGHELGSSVAPGPLQQVMAEISRVWEADGLGELRVGDMGRAIEFRHCYECESSKHGLTTLPCDFKGRMMGAALSYAVKERVRLTETKCCKKGDAGCAFAVKVLGHPRKS